MAFPNDPREVVFPKFTNLAQLANLAGSTGAKLFKNTSKKKWVVKDAKYGGGFGQVQSEATANDIYEALAIPVPKHFLDIPNEALILEYIDGELLKDIDIYFNNDKYQKAKQELCKGFVVDALLANWDVIGLEQDNIIIPNDGSPAVRIDNGGSLQYRAQGKLKEFGDTVDEIDTMRDASISPSASEIFGNITEEEINTQIKTLIIPNKRHILALTPKDLYPTMENRINDLIQRAIWTNAAQLKNVVEETAMPEYLPKVGKALVNFFKAGWETHYNTEGEGTDATLLDYINSLLQKNGAIISGGFILKAIGSFVDEKSIDIDIYVPTGNFEVFTDSMVTLFNSDVREDSVMSDESYTFLKNNGIVSVSKYSKKKPSYTQMDIIEIKADRTPVDVVKNFDLTFCENWYDGRNLFMTYPDHVRTKRGFLENHYLYLLKTGNPTILKRIEKYISRGFKVSIHNPETKANQNITETFAIFKKIKPKYNGSNEYDAELEYNFTPTLVNVKPNTVNVNTVNYVRITDEIKGAPPPVNISVLNRNDIYIIDYYTGAGSQIINSFLYSPVIHPQNVQRDIRKILVKKYPIGYGEPESRYSIRLTYYIFVNLYNALLKGSKVRSPHPFIVYRFSTIDYLRRSEKFYYMNSFASTTTDKVSEHNKKGSLRYLFFVHPMCTYMNISTVSAFPEENEILFTPYHRYIHIEKNSEGFECFAVLPTDLDIPTTFETFMPWKNGVSELVSSLEGGTRIPATLSRPLKGVNITVKRRNLAKTGTRLRKNNTTTKKMKRVKGNRLLQSRIKSMKMQSQQEPNPSIKTGKLISTTTNTVSKSNRFTDPIPSFPGKEPTAREMEIIQSMVMFFKGK